MHAELGGREYGPIREGVVPTAAAAAIGAVGFQWVAIQQHETRAGLEPAQVESVLNA